MKNTNGLQRMLSLMLVCLFFSGCLQSVKPLQYQAPLRCEGVSLTRAEWAIVRAGQERTKGEIAKLKLDLEGCQKARSVESERERQQREQLQKELQAAKSPLPWVLVVVVAIAGMAGVVGVALSK